MRSGRTVRFERVLLVLFLASFGSTYSLAADTSSSSAGQGMSFEEAKEKILREPQAAQAEPAAEDAVTELAASPVSAASAAPTGGTDTPKEIKTIKIDKSIVDKSLSGHRQNMQKIMERAKANIDRLNGELKNRANEKVVEDGLTKTNALAQEGEIEAALKDSEKLIKLSKDPRFQRYVRRSSVEKQRKIKAQLNEAYKTRKELERQRQAAERAKKKQETKEKHEAKRKAYEDKKLKKSENTENPTEKQSEGNSN